MRRAFIVQALVMTPILLALGGWLFYRYFHAQAASRDVALRSFADEHGLAYEPERPGAGELRGMFDDVALTVRPMLQIAGEDFAFAEVVAQPQPSRHHVAVRYRYLTRWSDAAADLPLVPTGDQSFDQEFDTRARAPEDVADVLDAPTRAAILDRTAGIILAFDDDHGSLRALVRWTSSDPPISGIEAACRLLVRVRHRQPAAATPPR